MIIFGTRSKTLRTPILINHTCPSCSTTEHAAFGAISYFHLFWIPAFMYSRRTIVRCIHCQKTSSLKELVGNERPDIKKTLFGFKKIWGYNFILLAFAALFVFATIVGVFTEIFA